MELDNSPKKYKNILDLLSSDEKVRKEVIKNHDNNLWWPKDIQDWKIRMLVAGLGTRISYNSINNFRNVIEKLNEYTYEELNDIEDKIFCDLIASLGLIKMRLSFKKSLFEFIDKYENNLLKITNNILIKKIKDEVYGAGYKVAQCCSLYAKGYYCGIMPVDSGMKDMLGPCLGFSVLKSSSGHEKLRKKLETITKSINCREMALKNGYNKLDFPKDNISFTWWAHLVLVYYKRIYCNRHLPKKCLLRKNDLVSEKLCN